jgi:hypothetical protein
MARNAPTGCGGAGGYCRGETSITTCAYRAVLFPKVEVSDPCYWLLRVTHSDSPREPPVRVRDNQVMKVECAMCKGNRWVCEDHPEKPWDGASDAPEACHCGGAGAPCPACNPCDREHLPEMPEGYRSLIVSQDWKN